jgi:hypothetical protein
LSSPIGTGPFHFVAGATIHSFGPYVLASGLVLEFVSVELSGGSVTCISPASRVHIP